MILLGVIQKPDQFCASNHRPDRSLMDPELLLVTWNIQISNFVSLLYLVAFEIFKLLILLVIEQGPREFCPSSIQTLTYSHRKNTDWVLHFLHLGIRQEPAEFYPFYLGIEKVSWPLSDLEHSYTKYRITSNFITKDQKKTTVLLL